MIKILLSLFLVFNFFLLDSCDQTNPPKTETSPKTETAKKTPEPAEKPPTPKTTEIAKNETPTPTPTPSTTETNAKKPPTPSPSPVNNKKNTTPTPVPTPTPTPNKQNIKPTPAPIPTPAPTPKVEADKSIAIFRAVDIVLGRKSASNEEKTNALKTVKSVLSVKEFKNARSKRNDPNLLKDRYPKTKELKVGKNQVVFWNGYDRMHFAARHLMDYFDTTDIKGKNSWWPAGTTQDQVDKYLQTTIEANAAKINLPNPGTTGSDFKYFEFDLQDKNKMRVSIGIQSDGRITSFFPKTGQNVISLSETDAQKLLTAIGK